MYEAAKPSPSENVARPSRSSEARYVSQVRSDSGVMEDCCPYAATHISRLSKIKNGFLMRTSCALTERACQHIPQLVALQRRAGIRRAAIPPKTSALDKLFRAGILPSSQSSRLCTTERERNTRST